MGLDEATTITWAEPGRGTVEVPADWGLGTMSNGGYLLALAGRAVVEATGLPHPLTSTAHYLARAQPGPLEVEVAVERAGRRHGTATCRLRSGAQVITVVTSTLAASPPTAPVGEPPDLPAPADCWRADAIDPFPAAFFEKVEVRLHPDDARWRHGDASSSGRMRGWFRTAAGEPPTTSTVLLASDALPPSSFNAGHRVNWTPTVSLTVDLLGEPTGEWLACSFHAASTATGHLAEDGEVWSGDRLVARSRQVALLSRR